MTVHRARTIEEVSRLTVCCRFCGWRGKGADTNPQLDALLQCPRCSEFVSKDPSHDEEEPHAPAGQRIV